MKLADLRRLAIRQQTRVRFAMPGATPYECVIDEHGIARVPGLRETAGFSLEEELAAVREFELEPVPASAKAAPQRRRAGRDEVEKLAAPGSHSAVADEHDE
ncbi:MAG: hypothetical protein IT162_16220 [Bryobacterales bacterium]|nr:hypothetical protein [Bryobacterales bacterium]